MRLAVVKAGATHLVVKCRKPAGAPDPPIAEIDDQIGVGAEQDQAPGLGVKEGGAVVPRGFGHLVKGAGADDALGLLQRYPLDRRRIRHPLGAVGEETVVLLRPDVMDPAPDRARIHRDLCGIPGGHHQIPGTARHADAVKLLDDVAVGARRIGQKNHPPATRAKRRERRDGGRVGCVAIVQTAPEIAKERVVASADLGKRGDDPGHRFSCR